MRVEPDVDGDPGSVRQVSKRGTQAALGDPPWAQPFGDVADVPSAERPEALEVETALVERGDDRQPERLAQREVLRAAAGSDVTFVLLGGW